MKKQVGNTMRRVPVRARAKFKALGRALADILKTIAHGFFAAPERQVVMARVKSGDRLQVTGNRGRKSSG